MDDVKEKKYVTLDVASDISGYTKTYLERLCRLNQVDHLLWNKGGFVIELESLLRTTHTILVSPEKVIFVNDKELVPLPPEEPALDSPDPDPNASEANAGAAPAEGKKRGRPKGSTGQIPGVGAAIAALHVPTFIAGQLVRAGVYHVDDKDYAKKIAAKAREIAKELED